MRRLLSSKLFCKIGYALLWLACLWCAYGVAVFKPAPLRDDPSYPKMVLWNTFQLLDLKNGTAPEKLRRYNGMHIRTPGFMVPLEDTTGQVSEFLLVESAYGCIHVPPPPPNQVIHVKMDKSVLYTWEPVWVVGRLKIENIGTPQAEFVLDGTKVEPYHGSGYMAGD